MTSARTLGRFLREAQAALRLRGAVSVLLTTDREIRRLNRTFRGKNKATDVLSFPAAPVVTSQRVGKSAGQRVSGDLAISVDTARKQAVQQGHALAVEVKVLMLHGLLHLAGYDHEIDHGEMARRERLMRAKLGLPLGLIERAEGAGANGRVRGRSSRTARPSTARVAGVTRSAQDGRA
jgi:probable rRNA maturation factor